MNAFMDAYRSVKGPPRAVTLNEFDPTDRLEPFYDPAELPRLQAALAAHTQFILEPFVNALGADFVEENLLFDFTHARVRTDEDDDSMDPSERELVVAIHPKGMANRRDQVELEVSYSEDPAENSRELRSCRGPHNKVPIGEDLNRIIVRWAVSSENPARP